MTNETITTLTTAQCEENRKKFDEFKSEVKKLHNKLYRLKNEFNQLPFGNLTWFLNELMNLESFDYYQEFDFQYSDAPVKSNQRDHKKQYKKIINASYALDSAALLPQLKTFNECLEVELPVTPAPLSLRAKMNIADELLNTVKVFQTQLICHPTPSLIISNYFDRWATVIVPVIVIAAFTALMSFFLLNPITAAIVLVSVTSAAILIGSSISVTYFKHALKRDLKPRDHALKHMAGQLVDSCQGTVKRLKQITGLYDYADENIVHSKMYSALALKRDKKVAALNLDLQALAQEKVAIGQAITATTTLLAGEDIKKHVERIELETTGGIVNAHPQSDVVNYVKARFEQEKAMRFCEKKEKLITDAIARHNNPDYLKAKYHKYKNNELCSLKDHNSSEQHATHFYMWGALKEQSVDLTSSKKLNNTLRASLDECKKEADESRQNGYKRGV